MTRLEDIGLKGRLLAEIHGEEYELANVRAVRGMMKKPLYHFYPQDSMLSILLHDSKLKPIQLKMLLRR